VAQILPFNGIRYNPQMVPDLSKVLCPPYDIISPLQQQQLVRSDPYNFVKIEFNPEASGDSPTDNRYTRALANIHDWLASGILARDETPAIYAHVHGFRHQGRQLQRTNLIGRIKLEEWDTRLVRPHENIIPRAKSDRMNMLRACAANTSEVLSMYEDSQQIVPAILESSQKLAPIVDTLDYQGDSHRLWSITAPSELQAIQQLIESQPLYIADGHHRYDSALTHRREMLSKSDASSGLEGFNYVMMALLDFKDPGLLILPTHRLLKGLDPALLGLLKSKLLGYFEIQSIDINAPDLWKKVDSLLVGLKPDMQSAKLAVFGLEPGRLSILSVRDAARTERVIAGKHSQLYKKLDVSLVDHVILDTLFGFVKDRDEGALIYTHDREEALDRVKRGEYQLAFILNPVSPAIIKGIADAADRMPRKSTYFYPKSPAGLVFYKW
jgi:uncharacterized protein (DUF1015 family)